MLRLAAVRLAAVRFAMAPRLAAAWCCGLACWGFSVPTAWALTPESPEVKQAVARGVKYLEGHGGDEPRVGGKAACALALIKAGASPDHPRVKEAVEAIRSNLREGGEYEGTEQIYHFGLSLIFLCNKDPKAHRAEIDQLLQRLVAVQKPYGAWGYPAAEMGDTSMTQYGVLALWECQRSGIPTPPRSWEAVTNWLLRTQDPGGAFGYQGHDPGNFTPVPQQDIKHSMVAAGLSSLYIGCDAFRIPMQGTRRPADGSGLPTALKAVQSTRAALGAVGGNIDRTRMRSAIDRGNDWFERNFSLDPSGYLFYYLYAFERYAAFRELAEGQPEAEPRWYTELARLALSKQQEDGSWTENCGPVPDTAFTVLFLVRSTRKSIAAALGSGSLVGGRGLPADGSAVELHMGRIKAKPLSGPADQLLAIMENPSHPEHQRAIEGFLEQPLDTDEALLPAVQVRLRKLAGSGPPEARAAALKALARQRNLDDVPMLILALGDPDWRIVREARDGLQFISRKFDTLGPSIPCADPQRQQAIKQWKAWYVSVRPDHTFQD